MTPDSRFVAAAAALGERGRGQCAPNPNVGCIIVREGIVVGLGWTQPGGRPHAEAMALEQAGDRAHGATAYVTLEPCAHVSDRGPACADALVAAGVARVIAGLQDPDSRTAGAGFARLEAAGIAVTRDVAPAICRRSIAGFVSRQEHGRPHVTLKLAMSLDGRIAMADGSSRWITGAPARAHAHLERARAELIVVGRGTYDADQPALDVRLPGLEHRSPRRAMLTSRPAPDGWLQLESPRAIVGLAGVDHVLVEGGSATAAAFLADDLVDRLLIYCAPILIGGTGRAAIDAIGLGDLADAHGRWRLHDTRMLGSDRLDVYERSRS